MSEGFMIATGRCHLHGDLFEFDPDTVITVWIDPATGRPPDVDENGDKIDPGPDFKDYCVQVAYCDHCIETKINPEAASRGLPPWPLARDRAAHGTWGQAPPGMRGQR